MTLVCNRESHVHARRTKALARLRIDPRRASDAEYVARKEQERAALIAKTSAQPMIRLTRKKQADGWSGARRMRRAGKGI